MDEPRRSGVLHRPLRTRTCVGSWSSAPRHTGERHNAQECPKGTGSRLENSQKLEICQSCQCPPLRIESHEQLDLYPPLVLVSSSCGLYIYSCNGFDSL